MSQISHFGEGRKSGKGRKWNGKTGKKEGGKTRRKKASMERGGNTEEMRGEGRAGMEEKTGKCCNNYARDMLLQGIFLPEFCRIYSFGAHDPTPAPIHVAKFHPNW